MATIVTRAGKGSALSHTEMDANFTNLNTDKAELSGATFTGAVKFKKSADVASATVLPIPVDGNYADVTGTTTVTSIATTGNIGTVIKYHFDDILTLTHHATDLFLPSEANITTAAGDEAEFIEYASGDFRCTLYRKASGEAVVGGGGKVLQVVQSVYNTSTTVSSGTYAATGHSVTITPSSTSSKILLRLMGGGASSEAIGRTLKTKFYNATVDVNAAVLSNYRADANNLQLPHSMEYLDSPATTSPITYNIYANTAGGNTTYCNPAYGAIVLTATEIGV